MTLVFLPSTGHAIVQRFSQSVTPVSEVFVYIEFSILQVFIDSFFPI